MPRLLNHRRRLALLAATVPATLAFAASADAATINLYPSSVDYTGTASGETIDVTPNGTGFVVESTSTMTIDDSAKAVCGPTNAKLVSCVVAKPLRVWAEGGADVVTMHEPVGGVAATGFTVDGGEQGDTITGNSKADGLSGGPGDDTLYGEGGDDTVSGDAGDDQVEGGLGNDTLFGGIDDDNVIGGGDHDIISGGTGSDGIAGGPGNDHVTPGLGDDGNVLGGDGNDTIAYIDAQGAVSVDLATTAGRDGSSLDGDEDARDFENIEGTASTDTLLGTDGPNTITTRGGADTVNGRGGADVLEGDVAGESLLGGEGDDILHGRGGADTLLGGGGRDTIYGGAQDDVLHGGSGPDLLDGEAGADTVDYADRVTPVAIDLSAPGNPGNGGTVDDADGAGPDTTRDRVLDIENVRTGGGADTIVANALKNVISCGDGVDTASADELDTLNGCEQVQPLVPLGDGGGWGNEGKSPTEVVTQTGPTGSEGGPGPGTGTGPQGPGEQAPPKRPLLGSTVSASFTSRGGRTVVTKLRLTRPVAGTTVTISCAAPKRASCPFKTRTKLVKKTAKRLDVTKVIGAKAFGKGAVVEVRVTGSQWTGVGTRYTFRGAKKPTSAKLTL